MAPLSRNARGAPPIRGMIICAIDGPVSGLNQISAPSPEKPNFRNVGPIGCSAGISRREIAKTPAADLAQPDVELTSLVGDEGHELPVGRNFPAPFRAFPVREARELGVGERVLRRGRRAPGPHSPTPRRARRARPTAATSCGSSRSGGATVAPDAPGSTSSIASISIRTSPMSLRRCFGSFAKQRSKQPSNGCRCRRREGRPVGLALENLSNRVGHRLAGKRDASGQHLVEHAAERPDVGAFVDRFPARLLRAHVGRGARE